MSGTVNWRETTLITFDMEVTCVIFDRNSVVSIQMYLLDQFYEFLTSLKVFLRGLPFGWRVPLASRLLYITADGGTHVPTKRMEIHPTVGAGWHSWSCQTRPWVTLNQVNSYLFKVIVKYCIYITRLPHLRIQDVILGAHHYNSNLVYFIHSFLAVI